MEILGSIDRRDEALIAGWSMSPDTAGTRLAVEFLLGDHVIKRGLKPVPIRGHGSLPVEERDREIEFSGPGGSYPAAGLPSGARAVRRPSRQSGYRGVQPSSVRARRLETAGWSHMR